MAGKVIGEMNGPWALAFKVNLALVLPYLIGLSVWVVSSIHALDKAQAVLVTENTTSIANLIDIKSMTANIDDNLTSHLIGHRN
jgi:hypothetical protein